MWPIYEIDLFWGPVILVIECVGSRGCGSLFCDDSRNMFFMHGRI